MSLGLPVHLAPFGIADGFARAQHAMAAATLVIALVCVLSLQLLLPDHLLWPAAIALVPMAVVLWVNDRWPSTLASVAYLLIGAVCVYWFAVTGMSEYPGATSTGSFIIAAPKIALILVGGVGIGVARAAGWALVGYSLAEIATSLAALQTNALLVFDGTTAAAVGLILVTSSIIGLNRYRVRSAKPELYRAARDEHVSQFRQTLELRAAAMLHDTVLNHLAALAVAPPGPLTDGLREQIARDLEVLVGEEWLAETPVDSARLAEWQQSKLATSIAEVRALGLTIEVSGDTSVLSTVAAQRIAAIALAVKQCLINVVKHAEVSSAEVVIYGSDSELSVMIVDAGKGFDATATGTDRMGLRHSVFTRIESVGGSVQLWSSPGSGTSVLIRVPLDTPGDLDVTTPGPSEASS